MFAPRFGLEGPANFEGRWHLRVVAPTRGDRRRPRPHPAGGRRAEDSARAQLYALRGLRVRPGARREDTDLVERAHDRGLLAARAFTRDDLTAAAGRALDFIRRVLWRDGRLLATAKDGRAHLNAYLDDYVYLADAILELQQLRFRAAELAFARQLIEVVLAHFEDQAAGGFFFTSDDHEVLIHRSKAFSDDATPSGNGIAAQVLLRLGHLLGEPRYLAAAERTLRAAWRALERYPLSHVSLVNALDELLQPPEIVILRGAPAPIEDWRLELAREYAPRRLVLAIPADAADLPAALADKAPRGEAVAYLCRGSVCSAPLESLTALIGALRARPAG